MTEHTQKSFWADLWERRFPQFLFTYFGIVWGMTQFLVFLTTRYDLPHNIVDKFLLFCTILLPAICIFIYNHGRPGRDSWKSYEKIFIPLNFLAATGAAFLVNGNEGLQAAPTQIEITTEEGKTETRLVPSINQTKTLIFFPLKNNGKEEDNWIKYSIPKLMEVDLEQDMRLFCLSALNRSYDYQSHQHSIEDNEVPFRTQLKIAQDDIADYMVTGEYNRSETGLDLTIQIHDVSTGELFFQKTETIANQFEYVDNVTKEVMEQLYLKDATNDDFSHLDLPVEDLITANERALENYIDARINRINNRLPETIASIDNAISQDQNSIVLTSYKAGIDFLTGNKDASVNKLEGVLGRLDDLPERQKFRIKLQYYNSVEQRENALKLMYLWKDLYPRDYEPYADLMQYNQMTLNLNQAKEVGLEALENGHGKRVLSRLADICIQQQNFEEAEKYIDEYYKIFPNKKKEENKQLPVIYMKQGKFEEAEGLYNNILLNNPSDFATMRDLGDLHVTKGEFTEAFTQYDRALSKSTVAQDSIGIITKKILVTTASGECTRFEDVSSELRTVIKRNTNPLQYYFGQLQFSGIYAMMGQEKIVSQMIEEASAKFPQNAGLLQCISGFIMSMVKADKEEFEKYNNPQCRNIITSSTPNFDLLADALLQKMDGNHQECITLLEAYIDSTGQSSEYYGQWLAESYRKLGDYKNAKKFCEENLIIKPGDPTLLMELSKTQLAEGNAEQAKKTFEKVQELWSNIEQGYYYYDDFKDYEKELESLE